MEEFYIFQRLGGVCGFGSIYVPEKLFRFSNFFHLEKIGLKSIKISVREKLRK